MINVALYGCFFVLSEQTCDIFLGHDPQGHEEYKFVAGLKKVLQWLSPQSF